MVVTLGQQYNVGEKPTVILYTYINRHAETPKNKTFNGAPHTWAEKIYFGHKTLMKSSHDWSY